MAKLSLSVAIGSGRRPPHQFLTHAPHKQLSIVIGGIGTMEGPIIGVAIFYLLEYHLAALGSWYLILLGTHSPHAVCSGGSLGRDLRSLRYC